jgi:hypothetical protein
VRIHRGSTLPAEVRGASFTVGGDIHLGPGQEATLAHEAWHVVQQRQGRVAPTTRIRAAAVNLSSALEHEADVMGRRARAMPIGASRVPRPAQSAISAPPVMQGFRIDKSAPDYDEVEYTKHERMPTNGSLDNDGYEYTEIRRTSHGAVTYERRKAGGPKPGAAGLPASVGSALRVPGGPPLPDGDLDYYLQHAAEQVDALLPKRSNSASLIFGRVFVAVLEMVIKDRSLRAEDRQVTFGQPVLWGEPFMGTPVLEGCGIDPGDVEVLRAEIETLAFSTVRAVGTRRVLTEQVDEAILDKLYADPADLETYADKHDAMAAALAEHGDTTERAPQFAQRLETLRASGSRESIAELRAYVNVFAGALVTFAAALDPPQLALEKAISQMNAQKGERARALDYLPSDEIVGILAQPLLPAPRLGTRIADIEQNFDVIARKSGKPPRLSIYEAEMARSRTQKGIPIERGTIPTRRRDVDVTLTKNPPSEKAMAIGFQGATDFEGAATVGKGESERIYAALFPRGLVRRWGVDLPDQDAPSFKSFGEDVRDHAHQLFVIRYETSTKQDGQVHLYDDWLFKDPEHPGTFVTQLEILRRCVVAVVEIAEQRPGQWEVVNVVDMSDLFGEFA